MLNKENIEECNLLEERIINICKQSNKHFSDIKNKQITDNINLVYSTNYIESDINYILGFIYENTFYYSKQLILNNNE